MKLILSKLLTLAPMVVAIAVIAYFLEEMTEMHISENLSDAIYPIGGLIIFAILWIFLVPTIQTYLAKGEGTLVD